METKIKSQGLSDESRDWIKEYFDSFYATIDHNHSGVYSPVSHNHSGVYSTAGHVHTGYQGLYHHLNGATIAAGGTSYIIPSIAGFTTINGVVWPLTGVFTNMTIRLNSAQPASGSIVLTVQKNLVDTALVTTVPAGSGASTNHISSSNVAFTAGELLTIKVKNNATATSAQMTSWTCMFMYTTSA